MKAGLARALDTAAVIAWVIVATFLLLQWLPGDPAELCAGEGATGEEVALLRERLGLDQPLAVQLLRHAGGSSAATSACRSAREGPSAMRSPPAFPSRSAWPQPRRPWVRRWRWAEASRPAPILREGWPGFWTG